MQDIIKKEGRLVATPEYRLKKFVNDAVFKPFFRGKPFLPEIYAQISSQIPEVSPFMVISHEEDILHYILFILMMKRGNYKDVTIINAYTLLDIMLSNNQDYETVTDVSDKLVIIYMGYSEMKNVRQQDVVKQLVDYQRVQGRECYLIYKGGYFNKKYPSIQETFEGINKTQFVTIKGIAKAGSVINTTSPAVASTVVEIADKTKDSVQYDCNL